MDTVFIAYDGEIPVKWFSNIKEAITFTIQNGYILERIHFFTDGRVGKMRISCNKVEPKRPT